MTRRSSSSRERGSRRRSRHRRHSVTKRSRHIARVTSEMGITDLQKRAKSLGIPFGGLTKTKLVRRINKYI